MQQASLTSGGTPATKSTEPQTQVDWDRRIKNSEAVITTLGIIFAAVWGYYKFFRGRTFRYRLETKISGKTTVKDGIKYLITTGQLKNVGLSRVKLPTKKTGVKIWSYNKVEEVTEIKNAVVTLRGAFLLFEDHEWIEPGETIEDQHVCAIPCATKGEFETTEEFRLRVQKEQAAPIAGNLTINSVFAFESSDLESVYDADRQVLQVAAELGYVLEGVRPDPTRRALHFRLKGSTLDNNAESFEIAPLNYRDFEVTKYIDKSSRDRGDPDWISERDALVTTLTMNVPTAKKAKESMRLLVVCKPVSPFTSLGALVDKGKPGEYSAYFFYLNVELLELWVYDSSTGQVYARFRPRQGLSPAYNLYKAGRDDEALAEVRKFLIDEPTNPEAFLLAGKISHRRGDDEAAIGALQSAIFWHKITPLSDKNIVEAHVLLGRIFSGRGDRSKALEYLRSALELDRDNQEAKALLETLEKRKP